MFVAEDEEGLLLGVQVRGDAVEQVERLPRSGKTVQLRAGIGGGVLRGGGQRIIGA
ncbi:hypothetical protein ACL02R_14900 [Streptomyces sp. MS19]|uniref:hypothetical protein n=1 Tax=Streptomyces sp. MS19 TaxID=3385972 RepID=UPI0039A15A4C